MEPFVLPEQSQPVRENRNAILDDLYRRLLAHIGQSRKARGLQPVGAAGADRPGAVHAGRGQGSGAGRRGGGRAPDGEVRPGHPGQEASASATPTSAGARPAAGGPSRVAVILVDGAITDGRPRGFPPVQGTVAWADPILDALSAVRRDSSVRAVVLRVNSPGGSAFASDRIAREVQRLRESRKPVIVSMGDTAASGGYYVAAPGDEIIASPSVITGSIGIYAFKLDVAGLAAKLGVNTETFSRGRARRPVFDVPRLERRRTPGDVRPHGLPLPAVPAHGGRRAQAEGHQRAPGRSAGQGQDLHRRARRCRWAWSTAWAASPTPSTRPPAAAACPSAPAACPRW